MLNLPEGLRNKNADNFRQVMQSCREHVQVTLAVRCCVKIQTSRLTRR